jgi:CheY-like chemotaxis protein
MVFMAEERVHHVPEGESRKPRILLVEDEAPILELLRGVLTRFGYHVLPAMGPEEAIGLASSIEEEVDLLITDVAMPGMNGVELHGHLSVARPSLPVLYVSGYVAEAARQWGVPPHQLLEKPFPLSALNERVSAILAG